MLRSEQIKQSAQILLQASQDGNEFLFDLLLEPVAQQINLKELVDDKYHGNVLHWAANNGHSNIVKHLVEKYPQLINSKTTNGSTPLANALQNKHVEISDYLRTYQIAVDKNFTEAVLSKDLALALECLNNGANIDVPLKPMDGYTALFHATSQGWSDFVSVLVKLHADVNVIGAKNGFTPLHSAAYFGYQEIVADLIAAGADAEKKDGLGQTPLMLAKAHQNAAIIKLLSQNPTTPIQLYMPTNNQSEAKTFSTSYASNNLFTSVVTKPEKELKSIKLDELQESIKSFENLIKTIETSGASCITAFNAKCIESDNDSLLVDFDEFTNFVTHLKEKVDSLQRRFENGDVEAITECIKKNFKIENIIAAINGSTCNQQRIFEHSIIPSQEYGRALNQARDAMRELEQNSEALRKQIRKVHDGKAMLVPVRKSELSL